MARTAILAFLTAAVLVGRAAGQEPAPLSKPEAVDIERRICAVVCARQDNACTHASPPLARCDTQAVLCQSSCYPCVDAFGRCLDGKDATQRSCQAPFIACMKKGLASRAADAPPIHFGGGDGRSQATAVVISGALNEQEGIVAENVWTARTHPNWNKQDQALISAGKQSFDRIGYEAPDGHHEAWFDITSFFGKM